LTTEEERIMDNHEAHLRAGRDWAGPRWSAEECAAQGHTPEDHDDPAEVFVPALPRDLAAYRRYLQQNADVIWLYGVKHTCIQGPLCPIEGHICPKEAFLDDPITIAYGMGSEMVGSVHCEICDSDGPGCDHPSCQAIIHTGGSDCAACFAAAMAYDDIPEPEDYAPDGFDSAPYRY
jgi:hypothetical protein